MCCTCRVKSWEMPVKARDARWFFNIEKKLRLSFKVARQQKNCRLIWFVCNILWMDSVEQFWKQKSTLRLLEKPQLKEKKSSSLRWIWLLPMNFFLDFKSPSVVIKSFEYAYVIFYFSSLSDHLKIGVKPVSFNVLKYKRMFLQLSTKIHWKQFLWFRLDFLDFL